MAAPVQEAVTPGVTITLDKSKTIRLSFERIGTIMALVVIGAACLICIVATYPADWAGVVAGRIQQISGPLIGFVGTLGTIIGLSWGRGHMDKRIEDN